MKKIILNAFVCLLIIITLILSGCGDKLTAGAVVEVSTLTIMVVGEDQKFLDEVSIFVNGEYKGKTSKYGQSRGARTVVLTGDENEVKVEKDGYDSVILKSISASLGGPQYTTVTLQKKKIDLEVRVKGKNERIEGARVLLLSEDGLKKVEFTDNNGIALFESLEDGDYSIRASDERYEPDEEEISIKYARDGSKFKTIISLTKLPELIVKVIEVDGPLADAEVSFYRKKDYNVPGAYPIGKRYTNDEGIVRFSSVEHGEKYTIIVKHHEFEAGKGEIFLGPDSEEININMVWDID